MEGLGQWPSTTWGDYHNDVGVRWQEGGLLQNNQKVPSECRCEYKCDETLKT